MPDKRIRSKIRGFMKSEKLSVVSTVNSNGRPESALVAFSETNSLGVIFGTFNNTRKYRNIRKNPDVSLVIGWDDRKNINIQYEGTAREVSGKEADKCRKIHLAKNPNSVKYAYKREQRFFIVKPKWIRYSDLSGDEPKVYEIRF